jgi:hypothetical protein
MTLPNQRFAGLQLKAPVFVKKIAVELHPCARYRSTGDRQKHEDCETDDKGPKRALRDMHGLQFFA